VEAPDLKCRSQPGSQSHLLQTITPLPPSHPPDGRFRRNSLTGECELSSPMWTSTATMAPPASGPAAYKKKDGYLAMSEDQKSISWTPAAGSSGVLTIQVASITSMLWDSLPRSYGLYYRHIYFLRKVHLTFRFLLIDIRRSPANSRQQSKGDA